MSDLEVLWTVLVCLYGWECLCWVPLESLAFSSWTGRHWRMRTPRLSFSNRRGGMVLTPMLPPLGYFLLSHPVPFLLSPEGVLFKASGSTGRPLNSADAWLAWNQVELLQVHGRHLRIQGRVLLTARSNRLAIHWADTLRRLALIPTDGRLAAIRQLYAAVLDGTDIRQRWNSLRQSSARLRWCCNGMFLFVFVVSPLAIRGVGLQRCWPALLLGLLGFAMVTALSFRRAHHALYPEADEERFTRSLTILLAPTSAMRALDTLTRPILETFHPLGIAQVFSPPAAFRAFATRALLDLRYRAPTDPVTTDANLATIEQSCRKTWLAAVERFLRSAGVEPGELIQPPSPLDESCRSFCPRCRAQFIRATGECMDCGGVPLIEFASEERVIRQD